MSNKSGDGWAGNYKGSPQDPDLFLWTCKYQFRGEDEKTEKGSVILLK